MPHCRGVGSEHQIKQNMSQIYYAVNRNRKTACIVPSNSWEETQMRFAFGILMPDNHVATGIGRCDAGEFESRAAKSGFHVLAPTWWDRMETAAA